MTTDYPYELNAAQAQAFNTALNGNFPDTIALDSTISFPNQSAAVQLGEPLTTWWARSSGSPND
jgi:hypothetical protein